MNLEKRKRLTAWLRGDGIETGALNAPLGVHWKAHVRYVDRLPVDEQRRQYPELANEALPPRYPRSRVQAGILRSPLGPPLRALRRVAVRMRRRPIRK